MNGGKVMVVSVAIPPLYYNLRNQPETYKKFISHYLAYNYEGYKPIRVKGDKVICEVRL